VWVSDKLIAAQERHWKEVGTKIRRKKAHQEGKTLQDLPDIKGKTGLTSGEIREFRNSKPMRRWRNRVLREGNHVCKRCGATGPTLHVDHRTPLTVLLSKQHITSLQQALNSRNLFRMKNGQLLCSNCHREKTRRDAARYHWRKDWIDRIEQEWEVEIREFAPKPPKGKRYQHRPPGEQKKKKKKRRQKGHRKLFARCMEFSDERYHEIQERLIEISTNGLGF